MLDKAIAAADESFREYWQFLEGQSQFPSEDQWEALSQRRRCLSVLCRYKRMQEGDTAAALGQDDLELAEKLLAPKGT
jgi:hypothetical protein